jgi:hypothetical protein
MRVKWQYEIGVVDQDYQSARELLAMTGEFADSCYDEKDEEGGQAADTAESIPPEDSPPEASPGPGCPFSRSPWESKLTCELNIRILTSNRDRSPQVSRNAVLAAKK